MTGDRARKRAEAVERLRSIDDWCGGSIVSADFVKAMLWDLKSVSPGQVRAALVDLLSEDGPPGSRVPDGVEWPMYEDGGLVGFGSVPGAGVFVEGIEFTPSSVIVRTNRETRKLGYGERLPRPVYMARDGAPILVGETLYGGDGRQWTVSGIRRGSTHPVQGRGPGGIRRDMKPSWLSHGWPPDERGREERFDTKEVV